MISFLYGTDSFRIKVAVEAAVLAANQKKIPIYRLAIAGPEAAGELHNLIRAQDLFAQQKLIILQEAFTLAETVLAECEDNDLVKDKETILLIVAAESKTKLGKQNKKLFNFLTNRNVKSEEYLPLNDISLLNWARNRCQEIGIQIKPEVLRYLIKTSKLQAGNKKETESLEPLQIWRLSNEIDKLASFVLNKKIPSVELSDIDLLVPQMTNPQAFAFIDGLFSGNTGLALKALSELLHAGENEHGLLALVLYQLQLVTRARGRLDARKHNDLPGVHPFVASKAFTFARRQSLASLRQWYQALQKADYESKGGIGDATDALWQFVLNVRSINA